MNSKTSNYAVGAYTSCAYTPSSHSISILSPTSPYNGVSSAVTAVYTTSPLVRHEHGRLIKQGSSQSYDSNDVQAAVPLVDFRAIQVRGTLTLDWMETFGMTLLCPQPKGMGDILLLVRIPSASASA